MKFKLEGTIIFEAENIDDAFFVIGNHYLSLSKGNDLPDFLGGTDVNIIPIN